MDRIAKQSFKSSSRRMLMRAWKSRDLLLMLFPVLVGFVIFKFIPIANSFLIGFVEYDVIDGIWKSPWVGLKYFRQFFRDPFCFRIIRNTFMLGLYQLIFVFPAPVLLALLFNEIRSLRFKKITQTISYLPHFISVVVIVSMLETVFGNKGVVNQMLERVGLNTVQFMGSAKMYRSMYILSDIWAQVGWGSIVYMASIAGISQEQYESAHIDGATRFQLAWHITLPHLLPVVTVFLILQMGKILDLSFEKSFLMYRPVTYSVSDVIDTYVYRRGLVDGDFSYAGAVSLFKSVVALALVTIANFISRRLSETSLY